MTEVEQDIEVIDLEFDPYDWHAEAILVAPQFNFDEIEVFVQIFKTFDADKSGTIDGKELFKALRAMGQGTTQDEADAVVKEITQGKSASLDWSEFLQVMAALYPDKKRQYTEQFLFPAVEFPEFSDNDIAVFVQAFREFDEDQSGAINKYELHKAFTHMGLGYTGEEVDALIDTVDANGSGEIEFDEFLSIMKLIYPNKSREFAKKFIEPSLQYPEFSTSEVKIFAIAFKTTDEDGSGTIDKSELKNALLSVGQGASDEDIAQLLKKFDTDGSGEIDWVEYLEMMRFFYPQKVVEYKKNFLEPARNFPEFSPAEIRLFVQTFKEFDTDNSGKLDVEELLQVLKFMGQGTSKADIDDALAQFDVDNSGEIDFTEFLLMMRGFYPEKLNDLEREWFAPAKKFPQFSREDVAVFVENFRVYDVDESGSIDVDEITTVFKSMGQGLSSEEAKTIVNKYDADGSGEIEWNEFLQIMADLYSGRNVLSSPAPQAKATTPATKPVSPAPKQVEPPKPVAKATEPPKARAESPKLGSSGSPQIKVGGNPKCANCGKTVYPLEAIASNENTWHKGCFKCQAEGCGTGLTLKTFTAVAGKVYCPKHTPKDKPTAVPVDGNIVTKNAVGATKLGYKE